MAVRLVPHAKPDPPIDRLVWRLRTTWNFSRTLPVTSDRTPTPSVIRGGSMASTPDPATKKTDTPKSDNRPPKQPPMKDLPTPDKTGEAVKGGLPMEQLS